MNRSDKKLAVGKNLSRSILIGGLSAFFASLLLLFLSALLIIKGYFQLGAATKLAVASCVAGGFLGTLFAVHRSGNRIPYFSLTVGFVQFLLLVLLGLFTTEKMAPGMDQLPLLAACLCSSYLAGLLAKKGRKRKRSRA